MLWIALGLLTAAAVAAVIVPLLRPHRAAPPDEAVSDRAVYRDQLTEVARDVERGVLQPGEAEAARLEIERRLLATAAAAPSADPARPAVGSLTAAVLAAAVAAGAVALYLVLGSPAVEDEPFAARRSNEKVAAATRDDGALATDVAALSRRLEANPQDQSGWQRLAQEQALLQRWQDSAASYRRALAIAPSVAASAGYGEMLVKAAGGIVTPAAQDAFHTALAGDPGNIVARFYEALADAQAGKPEAALAAWGRLVAEAAGDAPYLPMLRRQMAETARDAGLPPPPEAEAPPANGATGPTAADMAAAAAMTPKARRQMIEGMVAKLAARLQQAPQDEAGWLRLSQAYVVLGETDKAADAAARAAALRPGDVEALLAEARTLIQRAAGASPAPGVPSEVPAEAVAILQRVASLAPRQPEALWYLGLAAAQRHRPDEAAAQWQRLLAVLPPDSDAHKTVTAALGALHSGK